MLHTFGKHADGLAVYEFVITHKICCGLFRNLGQILNYEKNDKTVENSTKIETTENS